MENEKVYGILSKVTDHNVEDIAKELAKDKNSLPFLIDLFPSLGNLEKMAILQIGLYSKNKILKRLISDVAEGDEIFYLKNFAKGILDYLDREKANNLVEKIVKRFDCQEDTAKIVDLATLGNVGSEEILPFLDGIKTKNKNKNILEQAEITKLHISSGITGVLEEYNSPDRRYSIRGLREAVYNSLPNEQVSEQIIKDLFSEETETLIDTTSIMHYDPFFPKEKIDDNIIDRLISLIEGDYDFKIKEHAVCILGRQIKKKKFLQTELSRIFDSGSYKKKGFMYIMKNKELAEVLKEVLKK